MMQTKIKKISIYRNLLFLIIGLVVWNNLHNDYLLRETIVECINAVIYFSLGFWALDTLSFLSSFYNKISK